MYKFKTRRISREYKLFVEPKSLVWILDSVNSRKVNFQKDIISHLIRKKLESCQKTALELLEIHMTQSCNLDCSYCYVSQKLKKQNVFINFEFARQILEKALLYSRKNKIQPPRIMFHGGEPLLVKDVIHKLILKYTPKLKFSMQTNGTLLTEEDIRFYETKNVNIGISIDPDKDDRNIEKRDIFRKIKMFKNPAKIGIVSTITKNNVKNISAFIEELSKIGVRSIVINPVSPEQENVISLVPDMKELISNYKLAIDKVIEINKTRSRKIVIDNIEGFLLPFISDYEPIYCRMSPCGAGRLNLIIAPNGDVYPCSGFINFSEFRAGNIKTDDFDTLLNSKICKKLRKRKSSKIEKCKKCPYAMVCGANCPIPLCFMERNLYRRSFYCKFYSAIIDYLFFKISQSQENLKYLISDYYLHLFNNAKSFYGAHDKARINIANY